MVNYVKKTNYRKTFQNKIFPELNSKKHTPSPTVWVLRNCGIAQNSSCGIAQTLSLAKAEKGNFARNDFCGWLRKLLFFRAKLMRKERKILRFVPQKLRKSFANGNPKSHSSKSRFSYFIIPTHSSKSLKGTVSVISSDGNARFTTVLLKSWSDQKCEKYRRFPDSKNA